MTILIERMQQGGETVFRVSVPTENAQAFEALLLAAAKFAQQEVVNSPSFNDSTDLLPANAEPPGKLLKRLRQACRMTQKEAAQIAGITQTRISDMEAGVKPITIEAAQAFAKRFGVSPTAFLKLI